MRTVVLQPPGEIELDQGDLQSRYREAGGAQKVVDMNEKKPPDQVLQDYKDFVALVEKNLPGTRMVYLPIKPSIK